MNVKNFLFVFLTLSLLALSACTRAECKTNTDCIKQHYTGSCMNRICVYSPIEGECGNSLCETNAGENKCTCPADCGICAGPVSPNMEQTCVRNSCLESVLPEKIKPVTSTAELAAGGDKIRVTTSYSQPFNMRSDMFDVKFSIITESKYNSERRIAKLALMGQTTDKRTITLAEKNINRNFWPEINLDTELIVNFPTTLKEGAISNLELQITYEYSTGTGMQKSQKSAIIKNPYRGVSFLWVKPTTQYPCPDSCDDGNPGTQDVCDSSTESFCEHRPIPGACGNFVCDTGEDRCTCPQDCGPCSGDAGIYTEYACMQNKCVAQLKPGITITPASIFDDRNIGQFHLQNNYRYQNPFDTKKDRFTLNFNLYDKAVDASNVKITAARLFEGTNEIAAAVRTLSLPNIGQTGMFEMAIPAQPLPEIERSITLQVWYEFDRNNQTTKGSYTKSIGKISFMT